MDEVKQTKKFPFFKSKLALRLTLYIFAIAMVSTLVLGMLQVVREYYIEKDALRQEFEQVEQINIHSIKENLWILNIDALKTIFDGLLQKRNFVYFKLVDEKGQTLIEEGKMPKKDFLLKKIPLYYLDAYGKRVYLGELTMVVTTKYIRQEIVRNTVTTIAILLITMLFVGFFILFLVWYFISRHLLKIQSYTHHIRFDKKLPPLRLDRKEDYWTKDDALSALVNAINRMQKAIRDSFSQLEYQSLHDSLVDLPNRRSLKIDLEKRVKECREKGEYAALYFLDLDFFKVLNDSLGHTVGDAVLLEVAKRLRRLQKWGVKVYRIGGDEFLILTKPLSKEKKEAEAFTLELTKEIQSLLEEDIVLEHRTIKITASIGIELFKEADDAETVIMHADNALYQAKEGGRNRFAFFYEHMQSDADKRLEMEQMLHKVLQDDEFIIYFQPKFDRERKIRSAETLVRVKGIDGELVSPGEFIPLAQKTGMILEIDRQIVRKVFEFIRQNKQKIENTTLKSIAINISPNQFIMADFPRFMVNEAKRYGIDPDFIILEITEEAVVSNVDYALQAMLELKKHGFHFSIDDFGTGYSSMRYLMNFPLDELKIDKSFIDHILDNERSVAVIQTIITLAKNFHLNVVAEGIETKEQLEAIYKYGDVLVQGYVFSRPLPKEEFLELLQRYKVS